MPICPSCGAESQGRFCAKCGTPLGTGAAGAGSAGGGAAGSAESGLPPNVAAALCYLPFAGFFLSILFLVIAPFNQIKAVRFHALQSLFLSVGLFAIWIAFSIVASVLASVPFVGWVVDVLLWAALSIAILVLWIVLVWKAYNNERWVLPVIGPMAEKQA